MEQFYHNLPSFIDPVALAFGSFSIRWYSVMYLLGFTTVYFLLSYRLRKGEGGVFVRELVSDWLLAAAAGLLIGARLGHVLFYAPDYYFRHPLAIVTPYDFVSGEWTGILGMSYFGGLIGAAAASWIFVRKKQISFWSWSDLVIPAIPAGYFFGRIGNFINGELYGRITSGFWGMDFGDGSSRHPSQLYEAFGEGLILFLLLWFFRNRIRFAGESLARYLLGYGLFRFSIEFLREPDSGAAPWFGWLTLGQLFSLVIILSSVALYYFRFRSYNGKQANK